MSLTPDPFALSLSKGERSVFSTLLGFGDFFLRIEKRFFDDGRDSFA